MEKKSCLTVLVLCQLENQTWKIYKKFEELKLEPIEGFEKGSGEDCVKKKLLLGLKSYKEIPLIFLEFPLSNQIPKESQTFLILTTEQWTSGHKKLAEFWYFLCLIENWNVQ